MTGSRCSSRTKCKSRKLGSSSCAIISKILRCRKKMKSMRRRRRSSRSRRRCAKMKKCRRGKATSNPFLNFLRVFRQTHCGWPQTKVAIEGAKRWCMMNVKQREKFYREACEKSSQKRKRRRRRKHSECGTRRHRRRHRRSRSKCGRSRRRRRKKSVCGL
ncbi:protamine-like [Aethina tumida]|uniref:protamine-like n=1 Tax=Aethina tumida TaxID=116153 RepID=UPI00096AF50B|nr:protamine-like [Aethina tumida]